MNNANKPAQAILNEAGQPSDVCLYKGNFYSTDYLGLTKLEYAAIHIRAGHAASGVDMSSQEAIELSVLNAKELFNQLDKETTNND